MVMPAVMVHINSDDEVDSREHVIVGVLLMVNVDSLFNVGRDFAT